MRIIKITYIVHYSIHLYQGMGWCIIVEICNERKGDVWSSNVIYLTHISLHFVQNRKQKISEAELTYGSLSIDHSETMKEIGELGLDIWRRQMIEPLKVRISSFYEFVASRNKIRPRFSFKNITHYKTSFSFTGWFSSTPP